MSLVAAALGTSTARRVIVRTFVFLCLWVIGPVHAACLPVTRENPELAIDSAALAQLAKSKLSSDDLYATMQLVAKYETGGCWAHPTGNFDNQLLSVGVMQWNFGQGSLQPLLKKFADKYPSQGQFKSAIKELMPKYGERFLDPSCRSIPKLGAKCIALLSEVTEKKPGSPLKADFATEVEALFNSVPMRQIQVDHFARSLQSVLDDLERVFAIDRPKTWQIAWAMDLKTQQSRFPTNDSISKIRKQRESQVVDERKSRLNGVVKWYEGLCESGTSEGIRLDCNYNVRTWREIISAADLEAAREDTVHFTHLVSRTARTQDGAYQGDAFQRRAAIALGKGSVHGSKVDFTR